MSKGIGRSALDIWYSKWNLRFCSTVQSALVRYRLFLFGIKVCAGRGRSLRAFAPLQNQCFWKIDRGRDTNFVGFFRSFFFFHSAVATSFAPLVFYNKDRREQSGSLHRYIVSGQWRMLLFFVVDCRKMVWNSLRFLPDDAGRIWFFFTLLYVAVDGVWMAQWMDLVPVALCCRHLSGVYAKEMETILFPVGSIHRCRMDIGRIFDDIVCKNANPAVVRQWAYRIYRADALAMAALGMPVLLRHSKGRCTMAGTSWTQTASVL